MRTAQPLATGGAAVPVLPAVPVLAGAAGLPAAAESGDSVDLGGLPGGARVTYRISQRFRYRYDGAAADLVHRLVVVPPRSHGDQTLRCAQLTVSAETARTVWARGADGVRVATVRLAEVPAQLAFDIEAEVDRLGGGTRPWLRATALGGRRYLDATPLTAPDAALASAARSLATDDPVQTARRLCHWVHTRIRYVPGSTDVATTAAAALAGGQGVCQDQAHVMLALCRAAGLPARYVSGHLVGDGPSHAWVEVIMPEGVAGRLPGATVGEVPGSGGRGLGAAAVAWDPCHDRLADLRYITVAVGRDYADVAPTSGWYTGSGRGTLDVTQRVSVVGVHRPGSGSLSEPSPSH